MSRTTEQRDRAAAQTEAWLDSLDPATLQAEDATDLRAIVTARDELAAAVQRLRDAVAVARDHGKSWSAIGVVLGVSKQAAQERFGPPPKQSSRARVVRDPSTSSSIKRGGGRAHKQSVR